MDATETGAEPRISRGWVITFADLLCLILTFFVMMSAMQKVDSARWRGISHSLSRSLDPAHTASDARPRAERNAGVSSSRRRAADLSYIEALVGELLRDNAALAGTQMQIGDDKLILMLPSALNEKVVDALAALLGNIGNAVAVQVYDPDGRITAMERATAIADALKAAGFPRDIRVAGLSGARHVDLVIWSGTAAP